MQNSSAPTERAFIFKHRLFSVVLCLILAVRAAAETFPITEDFSTNNSIPLLNTAGWLVGGTADVGGGTLVLTEAVNGEYGYAIYNQAFDSSLGINVQFDYYLGGGTGADGLSFFLLDGAQANPTIGGEGGGLGYGPDADRLPGVSGGYLGVGIDYWGNYLSTSTFSTGLGAGTFPQHIALRGPGNSTYRDDGEYQLVTGSEYYYPDMAGYRRVNMTLANGKITMRVSADGGSTWTTVYTNFDYASSTAFSGYPMPSTFKLGFAASTGGSNNKHAIDNIVVTKPVDEKVSFTAFPAASKYTGNTVSYTITVTNSGPNADSAAAFAYTVPAGITGVSWSYTDGGSQTGSGTTNAIAATLSLTTSTTVTFSVSGTIAAGADGATLANTATITPSSAFGDMTPADNTATQNTVVYATPTNISLSSSSVNQSAGTNGTVGTLSTTDSDSTTFTYALVSGTGSTDNASFNLSGSSLRANNAAAMTAGFYSVRVRTTDDASLSFEKAFTITVVDNLAPNTAISTTPASLSASASASFTFTGSDVSGSVASFEVSLDGGAYTAATSPQAYTGLSDGSHTFQVRAVDTAGNTDASPAAYAWTIDTAAPSTPATPATTVTNTNNTTPTITGTAEANSTVTISVNGSPVGTTTADGSGNWSYTFPSALTNGTKSITATATDSAGNVSGSSTALSVTIDTAAPNKPSTPDLATASDSGRLSTDNITKVTRPTLTGTAEANSTVTLYVDGASVATVTADGAGNWSYAFPTTLADDTYALSVTATDAASNTSTASDALAITIDTVAPNAPVFSNASGYATTTKPVLAGTSEAGSTVTLYQGLTLLGTATANNSGNWSFATSNVLDEGTYSFTATATDAAGNTGAASSALSLIIGAAPSISTQPASQTVAIGAQSSLSVVASGTGSLQYQWERSTDGTTFAPFSGSSATCTFASAIVANSGYYRVTVSNSFGSATSSIVRLDVVPTYALPIPDGYGASVTGGGSGASVVVLTAAEFKAQAESSTACTLTVVGTLSIGTVHVGSNKTIQGADENAALIGNLILDGVSNVVLRGLHLSNPGATIVNGAYIDGGDALTLSGAKRVFVNHCTFFDCAGYHLRVLGGSDNVTISWSEFYASSDTLLHRTSMQIGSAADIEPPHVTLHHNWWTACLDQGMPYLGSGYVHQYNNYINATDASAGSLVSGSAQLFSEHNVYSEVANPLSRSAVGGIRSIGNLYPSSSGTIDAGTDAVFTPTYSYEMLPASSVDTIVSDGAGNTAGAASNDPATRSASISGPGSAVLSYTAVTLNAAPSGFTPTSYQWRFNNSDISGATSSSYVIAPVDASTSRAGTYTVALKTSDGNTVVSSPFALTIDDQKRVGSASGTGGGSFSPFYLPALLLALLFRKFRRR